MSGDRSNSSDSRLLTLVLLPMMGAVFAIFLLTGAALPALPLYIQNKLGFGTFTIGLVAAAQFAAALVSRLWAGSFSDTRGPKLAVLAGLGMAGLAGIASFASTLVAGAGPALALLILGRVLMGGAESFVLTGAQSWGLGMAGTSASAKVIGWIGTAMFVSLAGGAPVGSLIYGASGFGAIGLVTFIVPLVTALFVLPMRPVASTPRRRGALREVIRGVTIPGTALAFASLGNGVMTSFGVLYFTERGWQPAWLCYTAFAGALVLARIFFGHLPDRLGGARTALVFTAVQGIGMGLMWISPSAPLAFAAAFVAGAGYALVYPGLGREAVRRARRKAGALPWRCSRPSSILRWASSRRCWGSLLVRPGSALSSSSAQCWRSARSR